MKQIIYDNYTELSVNTAEMIASIISQKPGALLCFPAGETSVGTFNHLVKLYKTGKISFQQCKIIGLDEWMNLGEMQHENCLAFLKQHLYNHIDITKENFCFFNGESLNPEHECEKADNFIKENGPIDMILLGVGMNGHLGLNEPGALFDSYSHIVKLDELTKKVGQKYFTGKVELDSGITLGLKSIMESKTVILQMNGTKKAGLVKRIIDGEITTDFPASIVKLHPNSFLLIDKEAASEII